MHFTVHEREKKMLANRENVCVLAFDRAPTGSPLFPPHLRGSEAHRRKREREAVPSRWNQCSKKCSSVPPASGVPRPFFLSLSLFLPSIVPSFPGWNSGKVEGRKKTDLETGRTNSLDFSEQARNMAMNVLETQLSLHWISGRLDQIGLDCSQLGEWFAALKWNRNTCSKVEMEQKGSCSKKSLFFGWLWKLKPEASLLFSPALSLANPSFVSERSSKVPIHRS